MALFIEMPGGWFKARGALVAGNVRIGSGTSFWFNTVVRGDVDSITIGRNVNVQDGSILHIDAGEPGVIGDDVTIGHRSVVHGLEVGDGTLIGIGAVILQRARIGRECVIGAGAVVAPGMVVPDRCVVMGVPGKVVRSVRDEELAHMRENNRHYVVLAARYARGEFEEIGAEPEGVRE